MLHWTGSATADLKVCVRSQLSRTINIQLHRNVIFVSVVELTQAGKPARILHRRLLNEQFRGGLIHL